MKFDVDNYILGVIGGAVLGFSINVMLINPAHATTLSHPHPDVQIPNIINSVTPIPGFTNLWSNQVDAWPALDVTIPTDEPIRLEAYNIVLDQQGLAVEFDLVSSN